MEMCHASAQIVCGICRITLRRGRLKRYSSAFLILTLKQKITEEELSESIVDKLRLIPDYVEEEIETDETSNDTFRQMYQGGLSKSEMEKPASRKFTARIPKPEIKVDLADDVATEEVAMEEGATEEVVMEEVEIAEDAETESSANENQEEI